MTETPPAPNERHRRLRRLRGRLLPLAILLPAVLAVFYVVTMLPAKDREKPAAERPPVNVKVQVVKLRKDVRDSFRLHGEVIADRVVSVSAEVAGRIEPYGRDVQEGGKLKPGQVIVRLNDELIRAEVRHAEGQRDQALAQLRYWRDEAERLRKALGRGVATPKQVEEAEMNLGTSQAALLTASAALSTATARLARTRIRAPVAGVLDDLLLEEGEYVNPGQVVAQIVDADTLKVRVDVPEVDVPYLDIGDGATISIDQPEKKEFAGRIGRIRELADPAARTVAVEITVGPPRDSGGKRQPRWLRPGRIVIAELTRQTIPECIFIPLAATIPEETEEAPGEAPAIARGDRERFYRIAYVARNGLAERRRVELGVMRGWEVRVLSGLAPGERLIVDGLRYVSDGKPVRIVDGDEPTPAATPASGATSGPAAARGAGRAGP